MTKKILFLTPYPVGEAPSQRFRFEQYFRILEQSGFQFSVRSFLTKDNWQLFYGPGNLTKKAWALISGIFNRLICLCTATKYEFIFIHREASPIGPPILEWTLATIFKKRIIYDFDDAIWLTDRIDEPTIMKMLKCRSKVQQICKWAYKVSCGNEYLCAFARIHCDQVVFNPTTIDTENRHNPDSFTRHKNAREIIIGWTGSHSTLKYLTDIEPVLQKLESKFSTIRFLAIADRSPSLNLNSFSFISWREKTEIEDLLKFDIGIMPLPDHEWVKGKCGFKALQYMSLGIPAVVSSVGVNGTIIDDGQNGYLCNSLEQWEQSLTRLIEDEILRKKLGNNGRSKVITAYSVASNTSNFLSLFE